MFNKSLTVASPAIVFILTLCTNANFASPAFAEGPCAPCVGTLRRTVLVPRLVTEARRVPITELRHEERQREVIVYKDVPETVQRTRTITVLEPQVRSHQETYTVRRKVVKDVPETYTVLVPYTEMRTATRLVPKPVYKEIERKFTVCVDRGCFEERVACPVCKPVCKPVCRPCCKPCATCAVAVRVPVCKTRVWVPKLVKQEIPYTVDVVEKVQVPYEYEVTLCRPEVRTKIEKVCTLVPTPETYQYEVQLTRPETRTRMVPVCEYVPETRTRTVNETVCVPREKTETYTETVCRRVAEKRICKESVCVPVTTTREVPVNVCRLVPKTVEVPVAVKPVCCVPAVTHCRVARCSTVK